MNKPQGGLGRGLGALIPQIIAPEAQTEAGQEAQTQLKIAEVAPDRIVPNPHQPRRQFNEQELADLVASIKEHGILQPLVVTELGDGRYELIAGERRLRASKVAGLAKVPVVIRGASKQEKLELALIENIQRHDLNPVEEAMAYQSLMDLFGLSQEEVALRVGKSRSQVSNTIRLLGLDQDVLDALAEKRITRSHARTLLSEPDRAKRKQLFRDMLEGQVTVRQAEAIAGAGVAEARSQRSHAEKDPNVIALETAIRDALGTKVSISMREGKGTINIAFYSKADLRNLVEKLTGSD